MAADVTDRNGGKPPDESEPDKGGRVRRGFGRIWRTLISAGFLFGIVLLLLFIRYSGLLEAVQPETGGIVHIESPQIYTRERLVNDRFREQAWLEKQLLELEDRARVISSYRKDSFRIAAGLPKPAEEGGDTPAATPPPAPAQPETQAAAANGDNLEEKLLVSADDSFNLQRNMRATIRRALIENELDDRHDLGSNSLYQFNFGAAIVVGERTRRIAAIEMEIDPVDPLQPLDAAIDGDDTRCAGLIEFECAWLFEEGVLADPNPAEMELIRSFERWNDLFGKWLGSENSEYLREADEIDKLLTSREAAPRIETLMLPFFDNLNVLSRRFVASFNELETDAPDMNPASCRYATGEKSAESIENRIAGFINDCIRATNERLRLIGEDDGGVTAYIENNGIFDVDSIRAGFFDEPVTKIIWDQYFRYIFNRFNAQCRWDNEFVTVAGENGATHYQLTDVVETNLLACISRSVIRDYGSHPFGQVERPASLQLQVFSGDGETRPERSAYDARQGLSSIVTTGQHAETRAVPLHQFLGIAARKTTLQEQVPLIRYPFRLDRLNRTCRHHAEIPAAEEEGMRLMAGYSSLYSFDRFGPAVDPEIGWNMIAHLICATYPGNPARPNDLLVVDRRFNVPIGLFRFISLLSGSQKTFSYSVQPSGAFDLQRRDTQNTWDITSWFTGVRRGSQIAAGGDTTESWIEKQYRIIGFGAQVDDQDGEPPEGEDTAEARTAPERRAKFGWYVFPANLRGRLFGAPTMDSANIKLSALVSLPAWWESVDITITTSWRDPERPGEIKALAGEPRQVVQKMRMELPTRLNFIRNHFPHATSIKPSLYQLHLPQVTLRACESADIVLKGERLWRSTVVTIGSQKSTLIQVMPDMRGIIARFSRILPAGAPPLSPIQSLRTTTVPVTVWTSEGQEAVADTVAIAIPASVSERMVAGLAPCPVETAGSNQ